MRLDAAHRPCLIVVRDGWGVREERAGNAVKLARTPRHDALWARFPTALVQASHHFVGLPEGQMGNSEVGHLNMGAGRVVFQDFARIELDVKSGAIQKNEALRQAFARAQERDRAVHLVGLVSDGGVHSHIDHLLGLVDMAKALGVDEVFVHVLTDGRDCDPNSGVGHVRRLVEHLKKTGVGRVASVAGRYYTMDRDKRWDRVQKGYDAMVHGRGPRATDPVKVLEDSYAKGVTDEFVVPTVIESDGQPVGPMRRGDQVVCFNFRADRMREICHALVDPVFTGFDRGHALVFEVCGLTLYEEGLDLRGVAYPPQSVRNHLCELVGNLGLSQFKCAETEKYAHVTFFWNGGVEEPCKGEARTLVPSPKVATYDLQPEMSAAGVGDAVVARLRDADDALLVVNFANTDMVGHSGLLDPTIRAVEVVDEQVGRIVEAMLAKGGTALITADHGNAEMMIDPETGRPHTAHTTCPVHMVVCDPKAERRRLRTDQLILADLAPTALELMGISKPVEMTGRSVLAPA